MSRNDRRALASSVFLVVLMVPVFMTGCTQTPAEPSPKWPWAPPVCPCKI
jgi:hypothetical protein